MSAMATLGQVFAYAWQVHPICHVDRVMEPSDQASSLQMPCCQGEKPNEWDCQEDGRAFRICRNPTRYDYVYNSLTASPQPAYTPDLCSIGMEISSAEICHTF